MKTNVKKDVQLVRPPGKHAATQYTKRRFCRGELIKLPKDRGTLMGFHDIAIQLQMDAFVCFSFGSHVNFLSSLPLHQPFNKVSVGYFFITCYAKRKYLFFILGMRVHPYY